MSVLNTNQSSADLFRVLHKRRFAVLHREVLIEYVALKQGRAEAERGVSCLRDEQVDAMLGWRTSRETPCPS